MSIKSLLGVLGINWLSFSHLWSIFISLLGLPGPLWLPSMVGLFSLNLVLISWWFLSRYISLFISSSFISLDGIPLGIPLLHVLNSFISGLELGFWLSSGLVALPAGLSPCLAFLVVSPSSSSGSSDNSSLFVAHIRSQLSSIVTTVLAINNNKNNSN